MGSELIQVSTDSVGLAADLNAPWRRELPNSHYRARVSDFHMQSSVTAYLQVSHAGDSPCSVSEKTNFPLPNNTTRVNDP